MGNSLFSGKLTRDHFRPFLEELALKYKCAGDIIKLTEELLEGAPEGTYTPQEVLGLVFEKRGALIARRVEKELATRTTH